MWIDTGTELVNLDHVATVRVSRAHTNSGTYQVEAIFADTEQGSVALADGPKHYMELTVKSIALALFEKESGCLAMPAALDAVLMWGMKVDQGEDVTHVGPNRDSTGES